VPYAGNMEAFLVIGRILLVLIFLGTGLAHLTQPAEFVAYGRSRGVRACTGIVLATGAWMLVAGLMVGLGVWGDLGALMLVAFLVPTAFAVHHFWRDEDPHTKAHETSQFMKNISIAGGALLAFVLFHTEAAGWTLTGPLFK
jgi:putative oxidoreductase